MLVTRLTSQSGIAPYSLDEHNPSTGFVLKHVEIADAKLLLVIVVTARTRLKNDPIIAKTKNTIRIRQGILLVAQALWKRSRERPIL